MSMDSIIEVFYHLNKMLTPLPWKYLEPSCTLCVELFSGCSGVQCTHAAISSVTRETIYNC